LGRLGRPGLVGVVLGVGRLGVGVERQLRERDKSSNSSREEGRRRTRSRCWFIGGRLIMEIDW
jgi:hypothetical protein